MRKIESVALIFQLFVAVACMNIAHVPGRSGDIIVAPDHHEESSIIMSSTPLTQSDAIQDRNVANIICQLLHVPLLNPNLAGDLSIEQSFSRRHMANLLLVFDALSSEELPKNAAREGHLRNSYKMKRTNFPSDTVSDLTNFATGYGPEQHGVVSASWMSSQGEVKAYKAKALSRVATVADIVAQVSSGQSMVISSAADFQMASAFGVHPLIRRNYPFGNMGTTFWDKETYSMQSVYGDGDKLSTLTKEYMQQLLTQRYRLDGNKIFVFDEEVMMEAEELAFFAEISFTYYLVESAKNDAQFKRLITDQYADMITITFSSIKSLKEKYGVSQKLEALLKVLDSAVSELMNTLNGAYSGRLAHQIIFLGSSPTAKLNNNKQLKKVVFGLIHHDIVSKENFDKYFPSLYLDRSSDFALVCNNLVNSLNVEGYKVYCFDKVEEEAYFNHYGIRASNDTGNSDAAIFQITLWSSVLLILVVYAAIYSLFAMDVGADSLLYRLTTPRVR